VIAIDGPAASGKSTTARRVAERLGFSYLDTGAMYRASALLSLRSSIPLTDTDRIAAAIRTHSIDVVDGSVLLDGKDVSSFIRTLEVSNAASIISSGSPVRREMVRLQKEFGRTRNTVAEGRDMGTVVFPDAFLKIYVVADVAVRVTRRWREMIVSSGHEADFGELLKAQLIRDRRDRTRQDSPLRLAPGAFMLDSSLMSIDTQVDAVIDLYRRKKAGERS